VLDEADELLMKVEDGGDGSKQVPIEKNLLIIYIYSITCN
jgi:hypothetical protein